VTKNGMLPASHWLGYAGLVFSRRRLRSSHRPKKAARARDTPRSFRPLRGDRHHFAVVERTWMARSLAEIDVRGVFVDGIRLREHLAPWPQPDSLHPLE
jgi:streptomycin 6-kinase